MGWVCYRLGHSLSICVHMVIVSFVQLEVTWSYCLVCLVVAFSELHIKEAVLALPNEQAQ